ncbi:hypothetical protein LOB66_04190 [Lactobacillus delbrueckii subsp. lactis]|uniref:hypothetical protein n=1 Tax=Lactobacillus delbrueckii TaxID=1584 RepID=UPI001E3750B6|nr:hypothetical protein [Lactobacillus delbrueckii]MCD5493780.1 hypothetical protein [Lactobacillus delbrueckii subsp. lactis]MCD5530894.1 hypothetical protein [Lactobacillus delbrueckii subsp. lactis]
MKRKIVFGLQLIVNVYFATWPLQLIVDNSAKWRLSGPANGFFGFMDRVAKSISWPLFLVYLLLLVMIAVAALWTWFFEFKQDKIKQVWQKTIWFLQLIINELACLGLASSLLMLVYDSQKTWTIIVDLFMLVIVVILAFALTEKFTNRGGDNHEIQ